MPSFIEKHYKKLLVLFCAVFALQMWLCSGTLAPYAATLGNPHLVNDQGDYLQIEGDTNLQNLGCYYIANYDHKHYIANYRLLQGRPKEEWNWAYLLRRPLLYMISYPFMRMFGFLGGGFIIALLLNIAMLVWFSQWVRQRWGTASALTGLILLSSYPATMYWSGQPYPHILITACTLLLTLLLYKTYETQSLKKMALYGLLAGISFLAYDTYIFFLPAFGLLLLFQKKWRAIPVVMVLLVLPLALWLWFLQGKTIPEASDNTNIYSIIINAYKNTTAATTLYNLKHLPGVFYNNFTGATYSWLALFFVLVVIAGTITRKIKLEMPYWVLTIAVLTVFVFNNMAPPYDGWQMRGDWIARIYQPAFILCLLPAFSVLKNAQTPKWLANGIIGLACLVFLLNTRINVSPAFGDDSQTYHHYRFYFHSLPSAMGENLEKYGRRPLWVCP